MMRPPPLLSIHADGRELLLVRLSEDGQAGEVVLNTPSVRMTIRVPEIAEAVRRVGGVQQVALAPAVPVDGPTTNGPWSRVDIV